MNILLTGAGGQIGADLVSALLAEGHRVVATDLRAHLTSGVGGAIWKQLDVTKAADVEGVVHEVRPDIVFHLAAILSASGERNTQLAYEVNQTGTWNVLEACRRHAVPRFIYTSTIAVYGPGLPDPCPDDVPLHPTTMYGVTKASGEMLCEYYWLKHGLDCRGVRFPGLISASLPGGGSTDYALFMYVDGIRRGAYESFARADTRVPLMYMPDGVRALLELSAAPREQLSRCIYNIAAFSPRADEIAASVARAVPGLNITYAPDPLRQGILDSWPRALDDSLARNDWGWRPRYTLDAMTDDLVPKIRELVAGGANLAH
jgi:threonine 3-dehydrogenase